MVEKGLALQASSLREDELELQVPTDLVAVTTGTGAHGRPSRFLGEPSPRGSMDLCGREPLLFLGLPGGRVPV